ncbi:MAG: transcription elongation factor GreA [Christensenellales bacterium]
MGEQVTHITKEGLKKLQEELEYLKTTERLNVSKMIGEAKSFGDLSENSEYDAAKTREAEVEGRIYELENLIKNAVIITAKNLDTSKVSIGCVVEVYDEMFDENVKYKIIGATESDPLNGLISNESPVGQALLGRKVNDKVEVMMPNGTKNYLTIKNIAA